MIDYRMFTDKWSVKPLGEVVDFLDHLRKPVKASERAEGPYPYYGANGQQGTINGYIFDEPLILMAEDGGYFGVPGKKIAYRVDGKCWVNNHAHVLRPKSWIDINFLSRQLEEYNVLPYIAGTTRAKLTKAQAQRMLVTVPPIDEQKRIAAILDKADAIRSKREQAIHLANEFLRSVFLDMFGDPVTNPRGWEIKKIGQIGEIQGGLQVSYKRNELPVEVPYLRVANVFRDSLDLSEIKTMRVTHTELERIRLLRGDLLVVEGHGNREEIGRSAVWNASVDPCLHQNHLIRVRLKKDIANPTFVSNLLNSTGGRRQLIGFGKTTSGLNTISTNNVKNTKVFLPPIKYQEEYLKVVSKVELVKDCHEDDMRMMNELFDSLTQRAFCGEL